MARRRRKNSTAKNSEILLPGNLIPTGCSIFNCILADNAFGGYRKGTIVNLVGDSSAGKSILGNTTFAAANQYPEFDEYELIHDDAECANSFNMEKLFGKSAANRIKAPAYDKEGNPLNSDTIEDFHLYIREKLDGKKPFIYVLDSFDSIDSIADQEKIDAALKAKKEGNKSTGSYGVAKARKASDILRNIRMKIKETNSLLIIVSQVRDNLNAGNFGSKKTRSGGKALKHYSWHEIWLYLGERIKATANKKKRVIGVNSIPKMGKNRETGKLRETEFPIYYDLGIDDLGANFEFLKSEGFLKKEESSFVIPEIDFKGTKESFIKHVESNNLEVEIQKMVQEKWLEIENSLKLSWRKKRFE